METVDIDSLSLRAYSEQGSRDDKSELWTAVFELESWFFVPRGLPEQPHPYVAQANEIEPDSYWVYAFTDSDKCVDFIRKNNLGDDANSTLFLAMPNNDDLVPYLEGFSAQGVKGVYFNSGKAGFYSTLENLRVIKTYLNSM